MGIDALLGAGGSLAEAIPGFRPRPSQLAMAHAVAETIDNGGTLVVEAGTGTGKTFAYLAPAVLSGLRTVVSTGTRNLQDQLFEDDIPRLSRALGKPVQAELLKGRSNYLCRYRLEQTGAGGRPGLLQDLRLWAARTDSGDLAEFGRLEDDFELRLRVTSTTENCLGGQCPDFDGCFVALARRRAQEATVVVVNHHLLAADMALRDEGFGNVLPDADVLIIDEAHQFAGTLGQFFGYGISGRQLRDFVRDSDEVLAKFGDMPELRDLLADVADAARECDAVLADDERADWAQLLADDEAHEVFEQLSRALAEFAAAAEPVAVRGPELAKAWRRAGALSQRLQRWRGDEDSGTVRWAEQRHSGFMLQALPLDVGPTLQRLREQIPPAWILTSATLAVGDSFAHFLAEMGLEDCRTERYESPFDFVENTRLYSPKGLPPPGSPQYTAELVRRALPLIEAADGGTFFLCTSRRAVREVGATLSRTLRHPVLVQGDTGRAALLQRFREDGHAVLVGTSSFWEGVDVRGQALRLVIIDRLPFASPDDPVLRARREIDAAAGLSTFNRHQLPEAVLSLKQGAGRLIRDFDDRGALMIGDPRLYSKPYGRQFLASLPPMPRVDEEAEICAFLRALPRP